MMLLACQVEAPFPSSAAWSASFGCLAPCRCLARAQKLQLPHIEAYARLGLAKFSLQHNTAIAGPGSMEEERHEAGMSTLLHAPVLCCPVRCHAAHQPDHPASQIGLWKGDSLQPYLHVDGL